MAKLLPKFAELCRKARIFFCRKEWRGAQAGEEGAGMARAQGKALRAALDFAASKVYNI